MKNIQKIKITITQEMINEALKHSQKGRLTHDRASKLDALIGNLGEIVFAEHYLGDWQKHNLGKNHGKTDFNGIEVKCSAYPYHQNLNLLVKKCYTKKRKPNAYVSVIIDVEEKKPSCINAGDIAIISGYATSEQVEQSQSLSFKVLGNEKRRIDCFATPITELNCMSTL